MNSCARLIMMLFIGSLMPLAAVEGAYAGWFTCGGCGGQYAEGTHDPYACAGGTSGTGGSGGGGTFVFSPWRQGLGIDDGIRAYNRAVAAMGASWSEACTSFDHGRYHAAESGFATALRHYQTASRSPSNRMPSSVEDELERGQAAAVNAQGREIFERDPAAARALFSRARDLDPDSATIRVNLALAERRIEELAAARKLAARPEPPPPVHSASTALKMQREVAALSERIASLPPGQQRSDAESCLRRMEKSAQIVAVLEAAQRQADRLRGTELARNEELRREYLDSHRRLREHALDATQAGSDAILGILDIEQRLPLGSADREAWDAVKEGADFPAKVTALRGKAQALSAAIGQFGTGPGGKVMEDALEVSRSAGALANDLADITGIWKKPIAGIAQVGQTLSNASGIIVASGEMVILSGEAAAQSDRLARDAALGKGLNQGLVTWRTQYAKDSQEMTTIMPSEDQK